MSDLDKFIQQGQRLQRDTSDPHEAHRQFEIWDEQVSDYFRGIGDLSQAARWAALPFSNLIMDGRWSKNREDWGPFRDVVSERIRWLGESQQSSSASPSPAQGVTTNLVGDAASLSIFISHSSRDAELAKALVELFRSSLHEPSDKIRCTSVSGYKLPVGASTNEQLRRETVEARVLIGLITDVSIESAYVLFELGARWGANKFLAPILGAGRGPELLAGPLGGLNALQCSRDDLMQLVGDLATELGATADRPEAYTSLIDRVVQVSSELASQRGLATEGTQRESKSASLTDAQCELIRTISRPRNKGFIYSGVDEQDGREAADLLASLETFCDLGLMRRDSEGYRLTRDGWRLTDQLWILEILDTLSYEAIDHDSQVAEKIELTDGDAELEELHRLLSQMQDDGYLRITMSSGGWILQITEKGLTQRKHRSLTL